VGTHVICKEGSGNEFQQLIQQDDGEWEAQNSLPLRPGQRGDAEDGRQQRDVQDHEVQHERQSNCQQQPDVLEWRQA